MKYFYILGLLLLSFNLLSQRGKDGTVTIGAANTIVNAYTSLTANAIINTNTLTVTNSASFAVGDLILLMQMQGTSVNAYHGGTTGPWFDTNSALPTDTTFGRIINYYNTGKNEFAQVSSIPNATSIVIDCGLKNDYDVTKSITITTGAINLLGRVQVIKVPRYSFLTISGIGSITCPQWNGSTGGVAVVEVQNNAQLNTTGSFNVAGKGFRGGAVFNYTPTAIISSDKSGSNLSQEGGGKGESIAGDSGFYRNYASVFARGSIANGGGGGNSHNAGGGGGANGHNGVSFNSRGNPVSGYNTIWNLETPNFALNTSSGGGRGGYSFSNSNQNVSTVPPGTFSTATNPWGGDKRRSVGGFGGRPLNYINGSLFLGGGGGSGQGNDNKAGAGGNGGGIVYVVCYGNLSGTGTIIADGANGVGSVPGCASNDGAGGGGGGGTIVLSVNGTTSFTTTTALSANGGNGGNVTYNCAGVPNVTAYGPGAGGGGGHIVSSGTLPTNSIVGGNNGIVTGNSSNIAANFPPNGATRGGSGGTAPITTYTLNASANQTVCTNQTFTVTASSTEPGTSISWYSTNVGGTAITTGTAYAAPGYSAAGTYTLFAGACPGTYRQPIIITVNAGLTISVNSPTICPNQTVTLTASGATTYTWSTGPNTNSISVSPSSTTVYTVNGTSGLCSSTKTTNVIVSSAPTVSVPNATICSGTSTVLTASGTATSFTWMPGNVTTSTISANSNTTFTITGSNGTCTNSATATVTVLALPTVTVPSATICAGTSTILTASGTATSFTWMPGSITTSTISANSNTTYTITGSNSTCTNSTTATVTVIALPTVSVPSATICAGTSTILTASGTSTSFTWMPGSITTSTISANSNTTYTITGSNATCTNSATATVTVIALPTVSVPNATICSGTSTVLTASGTATSFTWLPGSITTSTISANSNTTYTITGSNGTCTNSTIATVSVTSTPTLVANSVTICPGQTATLTASGATNYTWNPGNTSGNTYTISPSSDAIISLTGETGSCFSSTTLTITIGSAISISVNSPTICAGQTASLTANGATSYTWDTGALTNTINVTPSSTQIYTVSGISGSCSGINTSTVTVVNQPILSVGNATICSGNSTTLTASGANSYTWMPGSQTTASVSVTPSSTSDFTVTGSNGTCTNSAVATVSVTNTPTLVANSVTICPGQTATLTASGATNYTWNPGNTSGNTYMISPSSDAIISLTGANGSCFSSTTLSVTIGSGISISVNSPTICAGQTASLNANGATSYTWDTGALTNTINVSPSSTQIYTVSGISGSCSGINTATVTVVNQPTLSVANASICSGNSTTLTASGASNFTWTPGGQSSASISVNPTSTEIYTLTGSNGMCSASITATVNVTSTPTLSANSVTICTGQTATLTISGATSYTWDSGNVTGNTFTTSPVTNTFVTVIGANGSCTAQATPTITIGSSILISVNSPTICSGQTASLTASGAASYTWDTGASTNTLNVSPVTTAIYTITGSAGSCNGFNTATVTVNSAPTLSVTTSNICSGLSATLTATGANTYTWSNGSNSNPLIVSPAATTFYTVSGTDSNSCNNTTLTTTTVNVTSTPTISVNSPSICIGQSATLTATGATSYTWSTFETTPTINPSPVNTSIYSVEGINGNCISSFTATVTVSQSPTLTVNAVNTSGCAPLCVNFSDITSTSCSTILYNYGDGTNGNTNNPGHCYTTGGNYSVTATCSNTLGCATTYTLPGVIQVSVTPVAIFTIQEGNQVVLGTTVHLTNASINSNLYTWGLCDGTTSSLTDINLNSADTGNCCITLLASNSTCTNSVTKCINIVREASITIPNVFTPNGDLSNEFFKIPSSGIKSLNCVIYDRWGLKMHEWDGLNGYWDGNTKTGEAPAGSYFYIINYTDQLDKTTTEKGFLNLFRD